MQAVEKIRSAGWLIALPVAIGAAAILFFFEPTHVKFYPRCLFHQWTGLSCPGCGGLRAAHQLLHGNVTAAFRLNPLAVLMLPLFAWMLLREGIRRFSGRVLASPFNNATFGWTVAMLVVVFGVLRNVPLPVFAWMNP